jgi:hypothetical protein
MSEMFNRNGIGMRAHADGVGAKQANVSSEAVRGIRGPTSHRLTTRLKPHLKNFVRLKSIFDRRLSSLWSNTSKLIVPHPIPKFRLSAISVAHATRVQRIQRQTLHASRLRHNFQHEWRRAQIHCSAVLNPRSISPVFEKRGLPVDRQQRGRRETALSPSSR